MASGSGKSDGKARTKWWKGLVPICLAGSISLAGCGGSSTSPTVPSLYRGLLVGTAGECSGPADQPARPVQVIVFRGSHVVVEQTKLGSHPFRFSLPRGRYRVTSNQSFVVPVNVVLHSGRIARVAVLSSSCD